ncbi:hypothetical protein [Streptomyces sp. NPDC008150]|uniref:hypothetical protein n=1 Tax=Streptomyces sp. NPDC008150 TaxID=3364816 RepID=UPI0036EC4FC6
MTGLRTRQAVSTGEGKHVRGRCVRDTAPEVALRRTVHRLGLRCRLQLRVGTRCTADFVLPRCYIAVFVDGCFWHSCSTHGLQGTERLPVDGEDQGEQGAGPPQHQGRGGFRMDSGADLGVRDRHRPRTSSAQSCPAVRHTVSGA